ncbi:NAD-dependent epimerase/dehydratase family protein [Methylocella tundrae]|uniref:NAD-dependent epimerase/dehydratase domain-containing protein n=1 Tax=Methylocella tundrae TaxID=227605 RepID=A0A4U8Z0F9_METTU|nr:NAD-dependent epimerase/dehydratase family protein [Methylocella tundrae]WPP05435.1 NAD-dependent epimerase/dehydratase family protein [Methylocella tundrae]VFU07848.1 conserved protein of unknown function [Methylocella tundrae]
MTEAAKESLCLPQLRNARCTVLGAGGFFGVNLCRSLAAQGAQVTAIGRVLNYPNAFPENVRWTSAELDDRNVLRHAVDGADFVFYLLSASVPGTPTREIVTDLTNDCSPALNLLEVCREGSVGKIVFASSGGTVYGIPHSTPIREDHPTNPISPYGVNKLLIEKYLYFYAHAYGVDYQVLRVSNPYGPFQRSTKRQGLVAEVIHRVLHRKPIDIWGDGGTVRDYIYIEDVVDAFLLAALYSGPHKVMNVASGIGRSIVEVISDIARCIGDPKPEIRFQEGRKADVPANVLDASLIANETGWRPKICWKQGLHATVAFNAKQDGFKAL